MEPLQEQYHRGDRGRENLRGEREGGHNACHPDRSIMHASQPGRPAYDGEGGGAAEKAAARLGDYIKRPAVF